MWDVGWLDDVPTSMGAGDRWPTFMSAPHPDAVGTLGPRVVACPPHRYGVELRWWQRLVAGTACSRSTTAGGAVLAGGDRHVPPPGGEERGCCGSWRGGG